MRLLLRLRAMGLAWSDPYMLGKVQAASEITEADIETRLHEILPRWERELIPALFDSKISLTPQEMAFKAYVTQERERIRCQLLHEIACKKADLCPNY